MLSTCWSTNFQVWLQYSRRGHCTTGTYILMQWKRGVRETTRFCLNDLGLYPGRSGPWSHPGVKFDRRYVRASHGLAGVMRSFRRRLESVSRYGFLLSADWFFVSRFLSAEFYRQQNSIVSRILSSADSVSWFCQQNSLVSRFAFCQQILSADFYSQQFRLFSEECRMLQLTAFQH